MAWWCFPASMKGDDLKEDGATYLFFSAADEKGRRSLGTKDHKLSSSTRASNGSTSLT